MKDTTYFKLGIQSEAQLGLLRRLSWREDQFKALILDRPVGEAFGAPAILATKPWLLHRFDWVPSSYIDFVSGRLCNLLRERLSAEFLPVRQIPRFPGQGSYAIMHLLARYYAMDRSQSVFTEYSDYLGGGVASVTKLVLDRHRINGAPAFVLLETAQTFFRSDICLEIQRCGFRGLHFTSEHECTFGAVRPNPSIERTRPG
jgi:hypothetical protein